jgi:hypothetical protein
MNPAFVNLILEIRAVKAEAAPLFSHDYLPGHRIPCELADAQIAASAAWNAYDAVIDRTHTATERQDALAAALAADNAVKNWNARWQRIGGTSDVRSIEETERQFTFEPMVKVLSVMP